jgi:multidrug efflux pump
MVPLFLASGAGAASRQAVATGVIGGMVAVTALGVFFTPLFYLSVRRWLTRRPAPAAAAGPDTSGGPATDTAGDAPRA